MFTSLGIRVSVAGALMVALGVVGLALLPNTGPAVFMMVGAVAVIVGFAMTLAHYYTSPQAGSNDQT